VRYVSEDGVLVETDLEDVCVDRLARALPVRKIRSHRGQLNRPGLFWSATTRDHIPYESLLELDRLLLADFDPDVSWIAAQPMQLEGKDGRRVRKHVPDLLLTRHAKCPLVVDVKPPQFASRPDVAEVFAWTARLCAAAGWQYEVWTGAAPDLMANVRTLSVVRRFVDAPPRGVADHALWSAMSELWISGVSPNRPLTRSWVLEGADR